MGRATYFRSSTSVRNLIAEDRFLTCSTNAPTQSRVAQGICGRLCHLWIRVLWDTTPARRAVAAKLAKHAEHRQTLHAGPVRQRERLHPHTGGALWRRSAQQLEHVCRYTPARQSPINRSFVTDPRAEAGWRLPPRGHDEHQSSGATSKKFQSSRYTAWTIVRGAWLSGGRTPQCADPFRGSPTRGR